MCNRKERKERHAKRVNAFAKDLFNVLMGNMQFGKGSAIAEVNRTISALKKQFPQESQLIDEAVIVFKGMVIRHATTK